MLADVSITLLWALLSLGMILNLAGLLTWVERKLAALVSDRIGANRCYIRLPGTNIKLIWIGLFHAIADGVKMMSKETFAPRLTDRFAYYAAPWLVFTPVMLVFAVIPFGGVIRPGELFSAFPAIASFFGGKVFEMQIVHIDGEALAILAISGISIIGVIMAGWASNNKYSLLGGIRAASQMISYELTLGLALLPMVLIYGTMDLYQMVESQSELLFGFLPKWGIFLQLPCAILYLTSAIAENKRIPFDLPEAESELIAGYFTEYSGMRMGLFMFAEFVEIIVISGIFVTFFLGGYNLPYMSSTAITLPGGASFALPHLAVVIAQPLIFFFKVFLVCSFQILARWTLPRFRYDQIMSLGWRFLLPIGLINLILVVIWLWATQSGVLA